MVARWRQFLNDGVQSSDNSTFSLLLPEVGKLHGLLVRIKGTNGATGGRNYGPLHLANSLRVVGNGDYRYFDLTANEVEKYWETFFGVGLDMLHSEAAAAVQEVVFPIWFGRNMYDPSMYLPLSYIKQPRLEIPYSPNIAADGGFATGTVTINVMGLWTPEAERLPYDGTLCLRTIKAFTSLASGDDQTDVTILDPIRAIGIYAYENQTDDGDDISRVRLEANTGEYDLWQGDWNDFIQVTREGWGELIRHNFRLLAQNTDVLDTRISLPRFWTLEPVVGLLAGDQYITANFKTVTGDRLTLDAAVGDWTNAATSLTADTTDRRYQVTVEGVSPSYFGLIDYADMDDPSGYLNPKDYDKLRVILTQAGAGADARIGVQYLHDARQS